MCVYCLYVCEGVCVVGQYVAGFVICLLFHCSICHRECMGLGEHESKKENIRERETKRERERESVCVCVCKN